MDLRYFTCPLTECVFLEPVVCPDGNTYELNAILYHFNDQDEKGKIVREKTENNIDSLVASPLTGELMKMEMTSNNLIKQMIQDSIKKYNGIQKYLFTNIKPYYLFKEEFINKILQDDFLNLINFKKISINDIVDEKGTSIVEYLFVNNMDNSITKIILDNSIDLNKPGPLLYYPIHRACIHSNSEIIRYMIDSNVNINVKDIYNNYPVHYIARYQLIDDNIEQIVVSEEYKDIFDNKGLCPLHIIAKYNYSLNNIMKFVNNNKLNYFEIPSKKGWYPIHYLCKYSTNIYDLIKILDLNINLKLETLDDNKFTVDDLLYKNKYLNKEQRQRVIRHYLNRICDDYASPCDISLVKMSNEPIKISGLERSDLFISDLDGLADYLTRNIEPKITELETSDIITTEPKITELETNDANIEPKITELETNEFEQKITELEQNGVSYIETVNLNDNIIQNYDNINNNIHIDLNDISIDIDELIDYPIQQ
ncbi:ankyrin repeat protein [Hokovirus HKV1]|uniref:Ankyrin repeat protein n=1 Tax=Hokovirus HKV1 TaxID=1977638 RepID=A0A1V0SFA6_9VIRU|nr:ankyrin repeat protein [Hokovirus HKV1]